MAERAIDRAVGEIAQGGGRRFEGQFSRKIAQRDRERETMPAAAKLAFGIIGRRGQRKADRGLRAAVHEHVPDVGQGFHRLAQERREASRPPDGILSRATVASGTHGGK